VETVRSTDTTRKVLENGQVLILKNGIRYGLNGTEIK
jgi:hypothetical protein